MIQLDSLATARPTVLGTKYAVASGRYLASATGMRMLEAGSSVVDAGVAAGLCINVLPPDVTGLGLRVLDGADGAPPLALEGFTPDNHECLVVLSRVFPRGRGYEAGDKRRARAGTPPLEAIGSARARGDADVRVAVSPRRNGGAAAVRTPCGERHW